MRWAAYNGAYTQSDQQFRRSASFDIHVFGGGTQTKHGESICTLHRKSQFDFQPRCEVDRA